MGWLVLSDIVVYVWQQVQGKCYENNINHGQSNSYLEHIKHLFLN